MSELLNLRLPEADPSLGRSTKQGILCSLSGDLLKLGRLSEPCHLAGEMNLRTEVRGHEVTVQCAMSANGTTPCGVTLMVRRFGSNGGELVDRRSLSCNGQLSTSVVLNNLGSGLYLVDASCVPYGPGYHSHFSTGPGNFASFRID